jgi:hypothetical protein
MANLLDALCTCPEWWRGQHERPECQTHEVDSDHESDLDSSSNE